MEYLPDPGPDLMTCVPVGVDHQASLANGQLQRLHDFIVRRARRQGGGGWCVVGAGETEVVVEFG